MRVLALDTATEACSVAVLTEDGIFGTFLEVGRGHAEEILRMVDGTLAKAGIALASLDGIAASVGPGAFTGVRISVSVAQGLAFGAGLPVVAVTTLEALALQALWNAGGARPQNTEWRRADGRMVAGPSLDGQSADGQSADGQSDGHAALDLERLVPGAADALRQNAHRVGRVGAPPPDAVLACLDARMGEVYWGCFSADAEHGLIAVGASAVGAAAGVSVPYAGEFLGIGRGFAAHPSLEALPGLQLLPGAREALPDARDMAWLGAIRFAAGVGVDAAALLPLYLRDKVALTEVERAAVKRALGPPK